jgi:hypothetical protein
MSRAENTRFDSWKEIAAHLQRDVRTVRRWEQDRALPVHRVPGGGRAAVYAYSDEIDEWLRGRGKKRNDGVLPADVTTNHDLLGIARTRDRWPTAGMASAVLAFVLVGGLLAGLRVRLLERIAKPSRPELAQVSPMTPDGAATARVAKTNLNGKPSAQASTVQRRIGKDMLASDLSQSRRFPIIDSVCPRPLTAPVNSGKFYGTLVIIGKNLVDGTITTNGPLSLIGTPIVNSRGTSISMSYHIGCCAPQDKQTFKFFVRTASGSANVEDEIALSDDPGPPCPIFSNSSVH